jgi:hypothetical protein
MDSVQRLRQEAQAAGHLASTQQEVVSNQDNAIVIEPADPEVVYVPTYNPTLVYGTWAYPDYAPYYFPPPDGLFLAPVGLIGFGIGIAVIDEFWGWNRWDWRNHRMNIDDHRFETMNRGRSSGNEGVWAHDPAHRHGVPYSSPAMRAHFQGAADQARQNFRGFAPRAQNPVQQSNIQRSNTFARQMNVTQRAQTPIANTQLQMISQHAQKRQAAPAFESFSRGPEVHAQSQRGAYSRSTMPGAPSRATPSLRGGGSNAVGGHNADERRR